MKLNRFAIIGCSRIAKSHIDAIMESAELNLVAVCDPVKERSKEYATLGKCTAYLSHQEMLNKENIDIVSIATPNGLHVSLATDAIMARKHVIIEKPLAINLADIDLLIKLAKKEGVKLGAIHQVRYNPLLQYVKEVIDNGSLGKISHANVTVRWNRNDEYFSEAPWRGTKSMDGGMLLNQAIHQVDAFFWLLGPVLELYGITATRLRNIETEDVGCAIVRFKNGALGTVEAAITVYPKNLEEGISIFAEKGTIQIVGKMANEVKKWDSVVPLSEDILLIESEPFFKGHQRVFLDFVQAIEENRDPYVSAEEIRQSMRYIFDIYTSSKNKQPVIY